MSMRKTSTLWLATLCVAAIGASAEAATVTANASILDLSVSSNLTLSNDQYLSDAATPYDSGFDTGSTLTPFFFSTTQPNLDSSFAQVDDVFAPLPGTQTGANHLGQGTATVLWTFDFTATETGPALLDFQYSYNVGVFNLLAGETGIASASFSAIVDGTSVSSEALNFFNNSAGTSDGIINKLLAFDVVDGQTGTVTVAITSVAKAAPVPVPAALPLLGSGLLSLIGIVRRRRLRPA